MCVGLVTHVFALLFVCVVIVRVVVCFRVCVFVLLCVNVFG